MEITDPCQKSALRYYLFQTIETLSYALEGNQLDPPTPKVYLSLLLTNQVCINSFIGPEVVIDARVRGLFK